MYYITKVISSYAYRLNILNSEHDVFYVSLLQLVTNDLLLSQIQDDI